MKEKLAMFLVSAVCVTSCVAVTGLAIKNSTGDHPAIIKAEDKVYSLTIDSPLYAGAGTSGVDYTTVKTISGTDIKLKYNKLSPFEAGSKGVQSGFNTLSDGSYIEIVSNEDIHGLGGLRNIQFNSTIKSTGYLKVSYGWEEGVYVNYKLQTISSNHDGSYSIDIPDSPSYLKIEVLGNIYTKMGLGSIVFTYSCEEIGNPYALVNDFYLRKVSDHYEVVSYVGSETNLVVPEKVVLGENNELLVTGIADGFKAAYGNQNIIRVTLPSSVTRIGYEAFFCDPNDDSKFTFINLDNVTYIADRAFLNCDSLGESKELNVDNVSFVGEDAFASTSFSYGTLIFRAPNVEISEAAFWYSSIRAISFASETSLTIGMQAFFNCSSLTSLTFPVSIANLPRLIVKGASSLTNINYAGTMEQYNALSKYETWASGCAATYIHCSDGNVTLKKS